MMRHRASNPLQRKGALLFLKHLEQPKKGSAPVHVQPHAYTAMQ